MTVPMLRAILVVLAAMALTGLAGCQSAPTARVSIAAEAPVALGPDVPAIWFEPEQPPITGTVRADSHGVRFTSASGSGSSYFNYWRTARIVFAPDMTAAELAGTWHTLAWVRFGHAADGTRADPALVARFKEAIEGAISGSQTTRMVVEPVFKPPWGVAESDALPPPKVAVLMHRDLPLIAFQDQKYGSLRAPDSVSGARVKTGAEVGGTVGRAMGPSIVYPPFLAIAVGSMAIGAALGGLAGAAEDAAVKSRAQFVVASESAFQAVSHRVLVTGPSHLESCIARSLQNFRVSGVRYTRATTAVEWRVPTLATGDASMADLAGKGYSHAIVLLEPPHVVVEHDPGAGSQRAELSRFRLAVDIPYEIATLDRAYGREVKPPSSPRASYRSNTFASIEEWTANDASRASHVFAEACDAIGGSLAAALMHHLANEAASR